MYKKYVTLDEVSSLLMEGDILLFEGRSIPSFFIKRATDGVYTHVGVLSGHEDDEETIWECVEFKELKGGRSINLDQYIKSFKGEISVFRAAAYKELYIYDKESGRINMENIYYNKFHVTNTMRKMTGLPYGWRRIWWISQKYIPLLRFFYRIESSVDDSTSNPIYPVCSTSVAYAFSAAGLDLIHFRSDESTTPSDIARSPLLSYLFTFK